MIEPHEPTGRYVGRDQPTGDRGLWWVPPGGAPWELLPPVHRRSADGPNWGYEGNGPTDAAEAVLLHVTGDPVAAELHAREFAAGVLAQEPIDHFLDLPATVVESWTRDRGIPLAPGWSPHGPQPVVRYWQADHADRYAVALDGWDLLRIDVAQGRPVAFVAVTDLKGRAEFRWTREVMVAEPDDDHEPAPPGSRVSTERLPFGGWAVQVDGYDVAILERDSGRASDARVAVYDRTPGSGFLVFDEFVRYRQVPTEPVAVGELLRRFTGIDAAARIRSR